MPKSNKIQEQAALAGASTAGGGKPAGDRNSLNTTVPEYIDVPIFPLPNVTFFAQTLLPLHIFEPRYRAMAANAIAGDRLLGVALLREGWQRDYFAKPPICKTFGVGKIMDFDELEDGRFNIILEGLYRVRLVEEFPTEPFRTGRAQVLLDPAIDTVRPQVAHSMRLLREMSDQMCAMMPSLRETVQGAWSAHPHPLVTVNHLASGLVVDAYDRQSILEQDDPLRRIKLMEVQMRSILSQLEAGGLKREEVLEEE